MRVPSRRKLSEFMQIAGGPPALPGYSELKGSMYLTRSHVLADTQPAWEGRQHDAGEDRVRYTPAGCIGSADRGGRESERGVPAWVRLGFQRQQAGLHVLFRPDGLYGRVSRSSDVRLYGFGLLCRGEPVLRRLPGPEAAQLRNRDVYVHTRHVLFHGLSDRAGACRVEDRNGVPRRRARRTRHGYGSLQGSPTLALTASRVPASTGSGTHQ
jgi:hypothetical protein